MTPASGSPVEGSSSWVVFVLQNRFSPDLLFIWQCDGNLLLRLGVLIWGTHTDVHVSVIMHVRPDDSLRCNISAVVFLETLVLELAK